MHAIKFVSIRVVIILCSVWQISTILNANQFESKHEDLPQPPVPSKSTTALLTEEKSVVRREIAKPSLAADSQILIQRDGHIEDAAIATEAGRSEIQRRTQQQQEQHSAKMGNASAAATSGSAGTATPATTKTLEVKQQNPEDSATITVPPTSPPWFNPNLYNHSITADHYKSLPHSKPSKDWLKQCAATVKDDPTLITQWIIQRTKYVLGDCIRFCRKCTQGLLEGESNQTATMAAMYGSFHCFSDRGDRDPRNNLMDYDFVSQVIFQNFSTRPGFENNKPPEDVIVAHLRLGDVIEKAPTEVDEMLIDGAVPAHADHKIYNEKTIWSVYRYLSILQYGQASRAIFVGGSHYSSHYKKSKTYAHCLQRALSMAGYDVELRLGEQSADQDFYFMSHAKKYIANTGGFSRMMGRMVQYHGGRVLAGRLYGPDPRAPRPQPKKKKK